jgi:hypothetical protein
MMFFVLLTLGFIFELGKNALTIESRQTSYSNIDLSTAHSFISAFGNEGLPRSHYENLIIDKYPDYKNNVVDTINKLKSDKVSDSDLLVLLKLLFEMKFALASRDGEEFTWLQDRSLDLIRANPHRLYRLTSTIRGDELGPLPQLFNMSYESHYKK